MKLIKRILFIIILILSLQSWAKADDIRDFEIEGISIGDSLLDYFTIEEIESNIRETTYKKKDYLLINSNWFSCIFDIHFALLVI